MPSLKALWLAHAPTSDGWAWPPTVFDEGGLYRIVAQLQVLRQLHTLLLRKELRETGAGQAMEAAWTKHNVARTSQLAKITVEIRLAGAVAPIKGMGIMATGMFQPTSSR